jgi:hypothetical protein
VIGRGHHADIDAGLLAVTGQHCKVQWDGCRVWVHDLSSRSGTYINGTHIHNSHHVTEPGGSLLRLGDILRPTPARFLLGTSSHIKPCWQTWNEGLVVRLAQTAYEERNLSADTLDNRRLAILADALEEAGCTDADMLGHLRGPGPHIRGCWVVDALLGFV